jgi:hypothetical protein
MAAPAPTVGIIGLRALQRDITRLCADRGDINRAFQTAGRQAAEPIATAARAAFPHASGTLAGDVRVTASRSGAAVRVGRKNIPYAGWIEFGGTRKRPHASARPFVKTGRYLFPAAAPLAGRAAQTYADALTRALEGFGWTNTATAGAAIHD